MKKGLVCEVEGRLGEQRLKREVRKAFREKGMISHIQTLQQ